MLSQGRSRLLTQRGQLAAAEQQMISSDERGAETVAEYREALAMETAHAGQRLQGIEYLVGTCHAQHPRAAQHGIVDQVGTVQPGGKRLGPVP